MADLEFHQFNCLDDNFGVLVHDAKSSTTASIDAPDAERIREELQAKGWHLTHVLVTHHHWDHTQGIADLKSQFGCRVIGPAQEASKIPTLDQTVDDGDTFEFGGEKVSVISTPGHTLGMINFYFSQSGVVFTGDTLFALGCGRIFEGDANMMWHSMEKLIALPENTIVYCGHEYTLSNARFSLTIDPDNHELKSRVKEVQSLRDAGKPTLPTTIKRELQTNPFLRAGDPAIRAQLGLQSSSNAEVFAEIRSRKDNA